MSTRFFCLVAFVALAACGFGQDREPDLLTFPSGGAEGPDEFAVLPSRALEIPDDLAQLPPPIPGQQNRTTPNPKADAIIALGGNPAALARPSTDGALVTYASRYGVAPNIRTVLAEADLEFRRRNDGRLLERWFNVNVYFRSYRELSLDQYGELERLRRLGIRTASVPPPPTADG